MTRTIAAATEAAARAPVAHPLLFVELRFASWTCRVTSGLGTADWAGQEWLGVGDFGALSPAEEGSDLRAIGLTFQLSGIDPALLDTALLGKAEYRRRPAKIWLGFTDAGGISLTGDPLLVWSGQMDVMTLQEGETATIELSAENDLIDLERQRVRRYTSADQQQTFPGDKGFDYVEALQDASIKWP